MAGERIDYTAAAVEAARSVLIELTHILGEYRDDMVLVGGWIPELLIPQSQERHVGSIDVDLALNHRELTEAGYRMIIGPKDVAEFDEALDAEERTIRQRDAFERVNFLLQQLGIA
jgi:hypothetical protein